MIILKALVTLWLACAILCAIIIGSTYGIVKLRRMIKS